MNPISLGTRRELFWDDYLVNTSRTSAALRQHEPRIEEISLTFDKPWEGDGCDYFAILRPGEKYLMYYLAWHMYSKDLTRHTADIANICLLESSDGIRWERPELGVTEFDGSLSNNIIAKSRDDELGSMDNFTPFLDTNPDCPADERIKATVGFDHNRQPELWCYCSGDGVHFRKGWLMTRRGKFDTQNVAFWDGARGEYRCYIRDFHNYSDNWANNGVRDIRCMTSKDFRTWSDPVPLDFGGGDDIPLYTNAVSIYPRAPQMLIGFPSRYIERHEWTPNYDQLPGAECRKMRMKLNPRYGLAITDCVLMTSRDGGHWNRWDEAWMRPGAERVYNWVYGDCYPSVGFIPTPSDLELAPDEYSMFCPEKHWSNEPAKLRRYSIRQDGFISRGAGYAGAQVVTKPVTFEGGRLHLNFSTSAAGWIRVAVCARGETLRSCELFGDSLDRVVSFDGDLAALAGKEVTLEFTLCDADLYSMQFSD